MFSRKWIYDKVFKIAEDEVEEMEQDVIKDKKEQWRRQQITDEGNDPVTSGQKAGEEGMSDIGGGGPPSDLGGGGGLPELPSGGGGGAPELPPLEEDKEAGLEEETRRERELGLRDQTGNKEKYITTTDKNYGEDPLGDGQNKEKSKTERTTKPTYRGSAISERDEKNSVVRKAPVSVREELKSIKMSLAQRYNKDRKLVVEGKKSMLDETNLIKEDKPL